MQRLTRNAFEIAWLPARARDGFLAELDAYLEGFDLTVNARG